MLLNAKITRYTVTLDSISVHLSCFESDENAIRQLMAEKTPQMIHFPGLDVKGTVGSINIRSEVSLLLKLPKEEHVARALWRLLGATETVSLDDEGQTERKLSALLKSVSARTGKTEEEILYEISTFTNKENRIVEGKHSITELSPKAREVVLRKLERSWRDQENK